MSGSEFDVHLGAKLVAVLQFSQELSPMFV